jgi:hypothetical protein
MRYIIPVSLCLKKRMSNAQGTLLSDLDGKAPLAGDGDLVKMIYQDMNSGQEVRPGIPSGMAPGGVQGPMMPMPPPQQSTQQYQMDPGPSTAHIIGGQHPTSADFAQMLQSSTPGFAAGGNWAPTQNYGTTASQQAQLAAQIANMQASQGKAWSNFLGIELKVPILIALLVFIVNLPFLSVLVAHYAPWMLKASGDMNLYGQISKALLVGLLFWGANRIILPLLG